MTLEQEMLEMERRNRAKTWVMIAIVLFIVGFWSAAVYVVGHFVVKYW